MYLFDGSSADEAWRKAALTLGRDGKQVHSRLGPAVELIHATFEIADPRLRWVSSRQPAMNPAFALAEVVWILAGREDADFLNFWNPALPRFAGSGPSYYGAYGARLRFKNGLDQIQAAYSALNSNPASRQVVLQIWNPVLDLPENSGAPRSEDVPCNVCSMLKVRDNKLVWLQVMRSNDLFLGTPHNFVQFMSLQDVIAGWLGLDAGQYTLVCDSLHAYSHDLTKFGASNAAFTQESVNSLSLPKAEYDAVFPQTVKLFDRLRSPELSQNEIRGIINFYGLPGAYKDMVLVAAADSARRRQWHDEMHIAMDGIASPMLISLWKAWLSRVASAAR